MVDSAKIIIRAGHGGAGSAHFRRERFIPKGGPDGGDGGRGGSVYIKSDTNLATLDHFAFRQKFEAKNGRPGSEKRSSGLSGEDLHLGVPVGTIVKMTSPEGEERIIDFDKPGMEELIAKGGKGGRGNWHFKSSTNTTPLEFEPGLPGQEWQTEMDLKILADVGLIGLPNAGKSTLLSILSAARPKIANYPFTTLEPNLGVADLKGKKVVLADIPGLIEGASEGKGLGMQFLRHIERSRVLVHLLAGEEAEQLYRDYQTVRNELKQYGGGAEKKKELVVLNKTDLLSGEKVAEIVGFFAKKKIKVLPVSGGNLSGIELLKNKLLLLV
ncbi:MAG: GTPase ObgE [Microgenomates group bacterium]